MEKLSVKKIVKNAIKLIISEVGYGLILAVILAGKRILETVVGQGAATAEIQRLNGEAELALTEALMHYNNTLHLAGNGLMLIIIILMLYAGYKFVMKTFFEIEASSDA